MISANVLLAFGLIALDAVAAGPCRPVTTSSALSSGTTITVDSTTLVGSTESTAVTITETETGTATTATSDATLTSDLTTLLTATSDLTTFTTEAATTTITAERPDSTQFNIYPNQGVDASGPLKVRTPLGGSVYFNNPNSNYATGTFVVNGRGKLVNGNQLLCAYFRTGQQFGDIVGCSPDETDLRYAPIDCELGTSGQLDCQVQGKFCYYDRDMLTCDARGLYPYFYIESAGSSGYGLILGSNGLNLTPVQLAAQPQPSEP
ncbi:hypothetical protein FOC1_g10006075 [Fusarium oxysporum f. sp. cubense race 1]|uniref:Uncharacterized protein n=1 Tax=Fusarium oxysporum f. sp. cubense (strain race 1) TaxID=1229664 RepID=N4U7T5_FUSC1|nr:hypothetical protein FOC1_g10006075 [Fusarium oxysporum f. sp. cubense race 1]